MDLDNNASVQIIVSLKVSLMSISLWILLLGIIQSVQFINQLLTNLDKIFWVSSNYLIALVSHRVLLLNTPTQLRTQLPSIIRMCVVWEPKLLKFTLRLFSMMYAKLYSNNYNAFRSDRKFSAFSRTACCCS